MASAADRCDEYPEFVFTRGEAWLYQVVERVRPDLFARIRKLIERGQWHITGGQFIQPDLNLPTAAGLHRQLAHGQRYFRDRFGIAPTIAYNVDSFGHTASLPDILVEHGYDGYVFRRPEQHQVALPANIFVWRGVAGGEVTAFRIEPGYVANFADLSGQVKIAVESADPELGHTMCFYGVGNHGGGPSKAMIEWIIANRDFEGHELVFSTPQAFMTRSRATRRGCRGSTPNCSTHFPAATASCTTSSGRSAVARSFSTRQRKQPGLLPRSDVEQSEYRARIDAAWDDLLFTEFHDILTGTSIPVGLGLGPRHAGTRPHRRRGGPFRGDATLVLPRRCPASTSIRSSSSTPTKARSAASSRPSLISTSTTGADAGSPTKRGGRFRSRRSSPIPTS